ncbi:MAG: EF-P lysine aminoacylase EpmA [Alphaproteobacteria bacterium]
MAPSPFWRADRHRDRRERLIARSRIAAAIRAHFDGQGFVETACSSLVVSPGNEAHLHAVRAEVRDASGQPHSLYLHTSPEFAMKELLAAGETKIYELARVFRGRESGPLNAPEFTMLEWYRAGAPYETVITDAIDIIRLAAQIAGVNTLRSRGRAADISVAPQRVTVAEAFARYADIDLLATVEPRGAGRRDALAADARKAGISVRESDSWSDVFSRVLQERIEPNLREGIIILDEYPRPEAALARASPRDPRVAERFEIYVAGVEIANGFGELNDAEEQRRRFTAEMDEKERIYKERYPLDEDFLAALAHMPPASGVALGFDRLVMLATDARDINDVLWTPAPPLGQ